MTLSLDRQTDHYLGQIPLLAHLPPSTLADLARIAHVRHMRRGEIVFHQGDYAHFMYILCQGGVRLLQLTADGQCVCMRVFSVDDIFGMLSVLEHGVYPGTTHVITDSVLLEIPGHYLRDLIGRHAQLGALVIERLVLNLHDAHDRIRELSSEAVEQRIARCLLRLADKFGRMTDDSLLIDIPLSRQDIAEIVGTRLETVSRVLKKWEREGKIISGREQIRLVRPHSLI